MKKNLTAERLVEAMDEVVSKPGLYEAFIAQWQDHFTQSESVASEPETLNLIERAARNALDALSDTDDAPGMGRGSIIALERLTEPAFVVSMNGEIQDVNDLAWEMYGLDSGERIENIPLEFDRRAALQEEIAKSIGSNSPDSFSMARCFDPKLGVNSAVLFIRVPSANAAPQTLIIVNTGRSAEVSAQLLTDACDLSQNENTVLALFLAGYPLAEIAERRERSMPTIRNQLQSIFQKTGCNSQSDLMRLAFSLSTLLTNLTPVLETARRTDRQTITFLRPDGRVVEAVVAGARQGRLVIALPSIFGHPLTSAIEERLAQADIRMLCLMSPGMGKTDPVPEGMDELDCLAGDIEAILNQLNEEQFVLTGRASSAPVVFALCNTMSLRVSKAIVVSSIVPSIFVERTQIKSDWSRSLVTAAMASNNVALLIIRSGRRLMRAIGPQSFLKRMYATSASDLITLDDQTVVDSIEHGVQTITAQGFDAGSRDMTRAFSDWSDLVAACPTCVKMLHGTEDPNIPLEAARALADRFPTQCELIEIQGGGLLNYSHCDEIIEHFLTA